MYFQIRAHVLVFPSEREKAVLGSRLWDCSRSLGTARAVPGGCSSGMCASAKARLSWCSWGHLRLLQPGLGLSQVPPVDLDGAGEELVGIFVLFLGFDT